MSGLDPEARDFVDMVSANPPPPADAIPLEEFRRALHDVRHLAGPAEEMHRVEEIALPGPVGELAARHYTPARPELAGLLVYFHGGGFVRGDLDSHDPLCRRLARAGACEVLSVDYRLAPEHPFPAAADDAVSAVGWASERFGEPLVVGGDSSGASLAAGVALAARDAGGPPLAAQLLIYPVTDATLSAKSLGKLAEGRVLTRASMEWFYDQYLPAGADRRDPRASPLFAESHADLPPAIVVTAGQDPVRDDGVRYAERLAAAGVRVRHLAYGGTLHNFMLITEALSIGLEATAAVGAELRRACQTPRNQP